MLVGAPFFLLTRDLAPKVLELAQKRHSFLYLANNLGFDYPVTMEAFSMEMLEIKSNAFNEGAWIPVKNSARGQDLSPDFKISGIASNARSIAITLDDASHPIFPNYNHWVIWNIPVQEFIPEGIPAGKLVDSLGGAVQGVAYGKNGYKGPKPPFKSIHRYVFTVYILDSKFDLAAKSKKRDLIAKINGHILQQATLSGKFQSRR